MRQAASASTSTATAHRSKPPGLPPARTTRGWCSTATATELLKTAGRCWATSRRSPRRQPGKTAAASSGWPNTTSRSRAATQTASLTAAIQSTHAYACGRTRITTASRSPRSYTRSRNSAAPPSDSTTRSRGARTSSATSSATGRRSGTRSTRRSGAGLGTCSSSPCISRPAQKAGGRKAEGSQRAKSFLTAFCFLSPAPAVCLLTISRRRPWLSSAGSWAGRGRGGPGRLCLVGRCARRGRRGVRGGGEVLECRVVFLQACFDDGEAVVDDGRAGRKFRGLLQTPERALVVVGEVERVAEVGEDVRVFGRDRERAVVGFGGQRVPAHAVVGESEKVVGLDRVGADLRRGDGQLGD